MSTLFTADTHVGHAGITEFCHRPVRRRSETVLDILPPASVPTTA